MTPSALDVGGLAREAILERFILTGAPGCGKTTVLEILAGRGFAVVAEAATDVIAMARARGEEEPHLRPVFISDILALQRQRRLAATPAGARAELHDRSAVCTRRFAPFWAFRCRGRWPKNWRRSRRAATSPGRCSSSTTSAP